VKSFAESTPSFGSNPNPSRVNSWPTYKAPFWQYLNMTAEASTVGESEMAENCRFWLEILPLFLEDSRTLQEKRSDREADLSQCK
jgi:hypothetical protein